jgi:hypothetical protein
MVPGSNGGEVSSPAVVTAVGEEAEGGGVPVNVRVFSNGVTDFGVIEVTYCLYDGEAIDLGFTGDDSDIPLGAWPLDYTWV